MNITPSGIRCSGTLKGAEVSRERVLRRPPAVSQGSLANADREDQQSQMPRNDNRGSLRPGRCLRCLCWCYALEKHFSSAVRRVTSLLLRPRMRFHGRASAHYSQVFASTVQLSLRIKKSRCCYDTYIYVDLALFFPGHEGCLTPPGHVAPTLFMGLWRRVKFVWMVLSPDLHETNLTIDFFPSYLARTSPHWGNC